MSSLYGITRSDLEITPTSGAYVLIKQTIPRTGQIAIKAEEAERFTAAVLEAAKEACKLAAKSRSKTVRFKSVKARRVRLPR
jgi:hypothetical protein